MSEQKHIVCVVGTRPEAIKMAPVIQQLSAQGWARVCIVATAQHRDLLDTILAGFAITPDIDLNIMSEGQSLAMLTARLLEGLDGVLAAEKPDMVIAQGDTTSVLAAAQASFYHHIPFAHVEAGLRSFDFNHPYPEEMNRTLVSRLASLHFAPTESARQNLLAEGINSDCIFVTGNTVIDALMRVKSASPEEIFGRKILVTAHRRENIGANFESICKAVRLLADKNEDVEFCFPVHPNPQVRNVAHALLSNHPRIALCAPLSYGEFVQAMKSSYLILTDSGGVQEEAPALGKPVLVLRDKTERPEAVAAGVVKVIGTDMTRIVSETQTLLDDEASYRAMAKGASPYGDGKAAERIMTHLREYFGVRASSDSFAA